MPSGGSWQEEAAESEGVGSPRRLTGVEDSGGSPSVVRMEQVLGRASIRRIGVLTFPIFEFVAGDGTRDEEVLALMGRDGWFRTYFGRGRRVELPDGTPWRVTAVGSGRYVEPRVTAGTGKLATAGSIGKRSYGINGRDYAYHLYPTTTAALRKPTWLLRQHDTYLATLSSRSMEAHHPVPLAAALLCFTLIKYGLPGDGNLGIPKLNWT